MGGKPDFLPRMRDTCKGAGKSRGKESLGGPKPSNNCGPIGYPAQHGGAIGSADHSVLGLSDLMERPPRIHNASQMIRHAIQPAKS